MKFTTITTTTTSVPVVIGGNNSSSNKIMGIWKLLLAVLEALHMR